jgi:DNA-directed RNA polymerase subunit beta
MEPPSAFKVRRPWPDGSVRRTRRKVTTSMAQAYVGQKRIRRYFGKIREVLEMPNLIEVQKSSYDLFLRSGDSDRPLDDAGIQGVFRSVFPIKDFNDTPCWNS